MSGALSNNGIGPCGHMTPTRTVGLLIALRPKALDVVTYIDEMCSVECDFFVQGTGCEEMD